MTLKQFIKENRQEIDRVIHARLGSDSGVRLNNEERRLWILNDEGLYLWARSERVPI